MQIKENGVIVFDPYFYLTPWFLHYNSLKTRICVKSNSCTCIYIVNKWYCFGFGRFCRFIDQSLHF